MIALAADGAGRVTARVVAHIADGSLHVDVEATYGLDDIKTALEHAGREARGGKVLITPNGPLA